VQRCASLVALTVFVSQNGRTALHKAALNGHLLVVEFLFERAPQLIEARDDVSVARVVPFLYLLSLSRPDTACDSVGATTASCRCWR